MNFNTRLFRRFFIPGLVIELLILICLFLPDCINPLHDLSFLKIRVGGPAAWKVSFVLVPLQLLVIFFFIISIYYSVRLPILYKREKLNFRSETRNFLIYGDIVLGVIIIRIIDLFCHLSTLDIESYVNLPVVLPVFAFGISMWSYFIGWTVAIYREDKLKFFSKTTFKSIGTSFLLLISAILAFVLYVTIIYLISESTPYINRIN